MIELGVDLGTANTVVCNCDEGLVLDEPSVMLLRDRGRRGVEVVAVGTEASELLGRVPPDTIALRPLQDGVITDLYTARSYLRAIIRRLVPSPWWAAKAHVVIGSPTGATALERRALQEAAEEAGIKRVTTLDEPIAGAIGCGIDPLERRVHMVVDIGGGTGEVTAFCYGGVLAARSCRVAGDEMTLAIHRYLREEHQLVVGEQRAEQVKIRAGVEASASLTVQGRDAATGRPRVSTIPLDEIVKVVEPITESIIQTLAACLDDLPPETCEDVMADGVLLFGGGSLTLGFRDALERAFGFPVKMAGNPLTCVAEGAARALRSPGLTEAYARY
ncbi:MAG: rod shape-determining protein [Pseudonocardia sp.]|nr:rod shape-determining protein [Pseudonocardia sp.]